VAGLMLTPFSAGSVAASSLTRVLLRRLPAGRILPLGAAVVVAGSAMLAFAHGSLWEIAVLMAVAGFGVGAVFGVMPGLIVGSVPAGETGSALSFNQVLRYIGYSIGSVLSAVVLQAATAPGHALPAASGYTTSGLVACGVWAATAATAMLVPRMLPEWAAEPAREMEEIEIAEEMEPEGQRPGKAG
jgi:MFS family permease